MNTRRFATPQQAEAAFYAAFENGDLEAMMVVWADDENIVCIHPLGPTLVGRRAVQQSWHSIFQQSPHMKFRIDKQQCAEGAALALHIVHENIELVDQSQPPSTVIATNVYRRSELGWYMILHHASPSPTAAKQHAPTIH
ncbi:MAG: YybH family protein [Acidiferrobacterales bacterium]